MNAFEFQLATEVRLKDEEDKRTNNVQSTDDFIAVGRAIVDRWFTIQ